MKTLAIIGSTGSVGISSLNVYKKNNKKLNLVFLATNKNYKVLKNQIKKYQPKYFYIFDKNQIKKNNKKNFRSIDFFIKKKIKFDYVVSGVASYDSIELNFKLTKISKNLLIANKETIICGGKVFLNFAKKNNCKIVPIDSEHHCIDFFLKSLKEKPEIKKIDLVASGGPFFNKNIKKNEKIKDVIKHPNWKMGKKISVDSSTFANKVLEMFEAKILFNLKNSQIGIFVEKKSNLHSIITLKNNISYFICHYPNMEIPISNSLGCKNSFLLNYNNFTLNTISPSLKKFPLIKLGYKILNYSFSGMIIFTVLNERLVNAYLKNTICYLDIIKKLVNIFKKKKIVIASKKCIKTKSDIFKTIKLAKLINI